MSSHTNSSKPRRPDPGYLAIMKRCKKEGWTDGKLTSELRNLAEARNKAVEKPVPQANDDSSAPAAFRHVRDDGLWVLDAMYKKNRLTGPQYNKAVSMYTELNRWLLRSRAGILHRVPRSAHHLAPVMPAGWKDWTAAQFDLAVADLVETYENF